MKRKPEQRLAIGLMSGTSLDGIDAVLVRITDTPFALETLAQQFTPFDENTRTELLQLAEGRASMDDLLRAHYALGHHYADAVEALISEAGVERSSINHIGCHGQTVRHLPEISKSLGREVRATAQIGDAAILAERTGIAVVSNFRAGDLAAGGQGAPLAPYLDCKLLADNSISRVALNIGGIANVTFLPPGVSSDEVLAFDTGPGNMMMDLLASEISNGEYRFDRDGEIAARGTVIDSVLHELLDHPFLARVPSKSTGREEFGTALLDSLRTKGFDKSDLMATLAAFTARSIADSLNNFWPAEKPPQEVIASGGGIHNRTLMKMLAQNLPGVAIRISDEFGVPADFKEAVAFAVLADATLNGLPSNLPSATGARRAVILGQITPVRR